MIALVAIARARAHGCKVSRIAWSQARRAGIPYELLLAVLDQESGGGRNEFGHDPTIFVGAGEVTRARYLAYKAERIRTGLMQGVGPMQLTWSGYQDAADALGGCDRPACNVAIGAHILAENIRRDGLHAGVAAYNGTGPAAQHYADDVLERADRWRATLNPPRARIVTIAFGAARKENKIPC